MLDDKTVQEFGTGEMRVNAAFVPDVILSKQHVVVEYCAKATEMLIRRQTNYRVKFVKIPRLSINSQMIAEV